VNDDTKKANQTPDGAAAPAAGVVGLPDRIAARVNPAVLERRRLIIGAALDNKAQTEDRRRRYVQTIIEHNLSKELKSA
jgi:hypothetical protein